ncbi:hypothetical protein [Allorhizocola rhizosphaerae]|uniref:hypothetical protein n=1 Tax=Allorhizocola rhizosphaerae TaxID=1872709 RepID=UPI0013C2F820|nr:hypothetical protein [Allorhizocola rhizosphaerae]
MDESRAIDLVAEWIRSRRLDYPTDGLEAERFAGGWSVYAPVEIDESDPMAFLDMPIGRSVFLVSDSGRIEESSSSVPPQVAIDRFMANEPAAMGSTGGGSHGSGSHGGGSQEAALMAEFEREFSRLAAEGPPAVSSFTAVDHTRDGAAGDAAVDAEASRLIEPIVQQVALLGPPGWHRLSAEFAFTVSSEIAQLRFWTGDRSGLVPVPLAIAELVRQQREVAARMPAGPWWRLLLAVTNRGETTVEYDYGDEPFPDDQLVEAGHYRNDLAAYPRPRLPVWLAGYVAGPAAQGRDPHRAGVAAIADITARRAATLDGRLPPLGEIWARWAVLSAVEAGIGSGWGPRIYPSYGWYENDRRSGATLFLLPGARAVLSGGKWNSALLEAAYNGGRPQPDLYTGAPAWVNDTVLNTRNRNGLLSFCFWWANGRWHRGTTDTSGDLDAPVPPVWTHAETVRAMAVQTGPGSEGRCEALLTASASHRATFGEVAALLAHKPGADVYAAANQLSLAGLLATQ